MESVAAAGADSSENVAEPYEQYIAHALLTLWFNLGFTHARSVCRRSIVTGFPHRDCENLAVSVQCENESDAV